MSKITVKESESFEAAFRRFKRLIENNNLLSTLKAKEFFEKPTSKRKRKKAEAVKRAKKTLASQALSKRLY